MRYPGLVMLWIPLSLVFGASPSGHAQARDRDGDGIPDVDDQCPDDPEDRDGFQDDDGCPDLDDDKDEVVDTDDQCPLIPGDKDGAKPGCPKKPALVVVTDKEIKITQQIHFAFDKAVIRSESYDVCDAVLDVLRKNPNIRLEIQGHTDDKGPPAYNNRLSQQRADAVPLHGGVIPYGGTFLVFSDYMRPAIRLAALMELPVIYIFTHDSIGLGEDGPTHRPGRPRDL